jgi:hypothetical protein
MNNIIQFLLTEKELLNKAGLNEEISVITGTEFDPRTGNIVITMKSLEEVNGITRKISERIKYAKFNY